MPDLRSFLKSAEQDGDLLRVKKEISPNLEISALLKGRDGGPILLFEKVKGSNLSVVGNVVATRTRLLRALDVSDDDFNPLVLAGLRSPKQATVVSDGAVQEITEKPQLTKLPVLTHYEREAGPYITASLVAAHIPGNGGENVSIHRLLVLDDTHVAARIVPRHLFHAFELARKQHKPLDVSISIGVHPALALAAAAPSPLGVSEFDVANNLMKGDLKLINCKHVNARAPADAEIVLEGRILPDKTVSEGPYVDLLGTYDLVRQEPVIEIVNVMRRQDAIYQAILGGGTEHKILMGITKEAKIWEVTRNTVPSVKAVSLTNGGCGWLHAVVSIVKQTEGDGKNVIMAAFAAHPSLKMVTIVDSDIDVRNLEDVEWAMATRFKGDKGLIVIPNVRGSSLDPTGDQETATVTKVGIDATMTFSKPRSLFEKAVMQNLREIENRIMD